MNRNVRYLSLISAVISIVAGVYMLLYPGVSLVSMAVLFACTLLVNGIAGIVHYFAGGSFRNTWDLLGSILTVLLSVCLFSGSFLDLALLIPYIFAFWVLITGTTKLLWGLALRKEERAAAQHLIFMGIIGVAGGILMFAYPLALGLFIAYMIAFGFVYQGVVSFILFFKHRVA